MNHTDARAAIESLFSGERPKQADLKAHLDGCLECRNFYDNTVKVFRAAAGRPEEMTEEELWLFQPAFPEVEAPRTFRVPVWLTGAVTVALAAAVVFVFVSRPKQDDGFGARGGEKVAAHAAMRVFCAREGKIVGQPSTTGCAAGDALMFSAAGAGKKYVAVVVEQGGAFETVADQLDGELGLDPERVLMKSTAYGPGLRGVAVFGDGPVGGDVARSCFDQDKCPRGYDRVELLLGGGK